MIPGMKTDENMVLCTACRRKFAIKGAYYGVLREGEYEVTFFACPLCGEEYQIMTTDEKLREMQKRSAAARGKIKTAREKSFRAKEIRKYRDEAAGIAGAMKNRADELRPEGDRILRKKGGGA